MLGIRGFIMLMYNCCKFFFLCDGIAGRSEECFGGVAENFDDFD